MRLNRKGFTIIEYMVYIPMLLLITLALYMIFNTAMTTDSDMSGAIDFYTESIILGTSIMKDILKGENEVGLIDHGFMGFVINGNEYKFDTNEPINFSKLNAQASVAGNKLIITTQYRGIEFNKEYNIRFWDGSYE